VSQALDAGGAGLTASEARDRLARSGPNVVSRQPRPPVWRRTLRALRDPLVLVLLAAAVLTTATGDVPDTVVILLVVVVNTSVAVWQEFRADRAVSALSQMAAPTTRVLRDGRPQVVPAAEVVPGDVVLLGEGDIVPADGQVLSTAALRVDESALTGESVAVDKSDGAIADDAGLVWAGTTVVHGRGRVRITATGDDSALGRIARMLQVPSTATPMQRRMSQLSAILAAAVLVLCGVVLLLGLLRGQPLELMVLTAISLAVAAVPESLPVVVSLSLALAARRMARRNAIARDLAAVETLGSVTVLATDKTGTLTEGRMSVEEVWPAPGVDVRRLLRAVVLCNDAHLDDRAGHMGDPTEVALLLAARAGGVTHEQLEQDFPRVAEAPFDSVSKTMTTVHAARDGRRLVVVKGAPEALLVGRRLDDGAAAVEAGTRAARLAERGYRVLAVAEAPADEDDHGGLLTLLGLVALHDPPRGAARSTIAACRSAGIRPVLVTGDHAATAAAIAAHVGIGPGPAIDLGTLGGRGVSDVADRAVLARATPAQKLDAVRAWQAGGQVVAMTGDGVNDGPALRRADIGVAMGRRGTEVARQAADLVLADDDLGTVVAAVEEGRRVYANVRRFLLYGLSGGAAEILVMLAGPAIGIALPLLPAQILWVNLLTHSLAGTALGAEPAEAGSMTRPPRNPAEGVLGGGLWWRILLVATGVAALSLAAGSAVGGPEPVLRSTVLVTLGAGQLGVALGAGVGAARGGDRNVALPLTVVAAALLLALAVLAPPLQALLGTAAVPAPAWWAAAATGLAGWLAARLLTGGRHHATRRSDPVAAAERQEEGVRRPGDECRAQGEPRPPALAGEPHVLAEEAGDRGGDRDDRGP
jgi:Ca2+-transporting ATPase